MQLPPRNRRRLRHHPPNGAHSLPLHRRLRPELHRPCDLRRSADDPVHGPQRGSSDDALRRMRPTLQRALADSVIGFFDVCTLRLKGSLTGFLLGLNRRAVVHASMGLLGSSIAGR